MHNYNHKVNKSENISQNKMFKRKLLLNIFSTKCCDLTSKPFCYYEHLRIPWIIWHTKKIHKAILER